MLVLNRKVGERIVIDGGKIVITVSEVYRNRVSLAIQAPREVSIHRDELLPGWLETRAADAQKEQRG